MPNAQGHDFITIVSGIVMASPAFALFRSSGSTTPILDTSILIGAHLLSGMMFSPDLDLDSHIDDRWGIFYWIWRPYMHLVPHRHFWSHGLIIAPLLRLLYFYAMLQLIIFCCAWIFAQLGLVFPNYHLRLIDVILHMVSVYPQQVLIFLLGFITGSAAHTIADYLVTGGKRFLTKMGFRMRRNYRNHDFGLHG